MLRLELTLNGWIRTEKPDCARLGQYEGALANAAEARRIEADRIGFIDPAVRLMVAEVLMRVGRKDAALARLQEVLRSLYMVSAAWLAIDPTWASVLPRASGILIALRHGAEVGSAYERHTAMRIVLHPRSQISRGVSPLVYCRH
jgi:ABC-type nitrate/sulfonate/bicarbonate transport system permease component